MYQFFGHRLSWTIEFMTPVNLKLFNAEISKSIKRLLYLFVWPLIPSWFESREIEKTPSLAYTILSINNLSVDQHCFLNFYTQKWRLEFFLIVQLERNKLIWSKTYYNGHISMKVNVCFINNMFLITFKNRIKKCAFGIFW